MLGIRIENGLQIDLWCGNSEEFDCDQKTLFNKKPPIETDQWLEKHIGIICDSFDESNFSTYESWVQNHVGKDKLRRVTFICSTKEVHSEFRMKWEYLGLLKSNL